MGAFFWQQGQFHTTNKIFWVMGGIVSKFHFGAEFLQFPIFFLSFLCFFLYTREKQLFREKSPPIFCLPAVKFPGNVMHHGTRRAEMSSGKFSFVQACLVAICQENKKSVIQVLFFKSIFQQNCLQVLTE